MAAEIITQAWNNFVTKREKKFPKIYDTFIETAAKYGEHNLTESRPFPLEEPVEIEYVPGTDMIEKIEQLKEQRINAKMLSKTRLFARVPVSLDVFHGFQEDQDVKEVGPVQVSPYSE